MRYADAHGPILTYIHIGYAFASLVWHGWHAAGARQNRSKCGAVNTELALVFTAQLVDIIVARTIVAFTTCHLLARSRGIVFSCIGVFVWNVTYFRDLTRFSSCIPPLHTLPLLSLSLSYPFPYHSTLPFPRKVIKKLRYCRRSALSLIKTHNAIRSASIYCLCSPV